MVEEWRADDVGIGRLIDRSELVVGDHIYVWRMCGTYSHHGIYVGNDQVIHFVNPDKLDIFSSSPAKKTTILKAFPAKKRSILEAFPAKTALLSAPPSLLSRSTSHSPDATSPSSSSYSPGDTSAASAFPAKTGLPGDPPAFSHHLSTSSYLVFPAKTALPYPLPHSPSVLTCTAARAAERCSDDEFNFSAKEGIQTNATCRSPTCLSPTVATPRQRKDADPDLDLSPGSRRRNDVGSVTWSATTARPRRRDDVDPDVDRDLATVSRGGRNDMGSATCRSRSCSAATVARPRRRKHDDVDPDLDPDLDRDLASTGVRGGNDPDVFSDDYVVSTGRTLSDATCHCSVGRCSTAAAARSAASSSSATCHCSVARCSAAAVANSAASSSSATCHCSELAFRRPRGGNNVIQSCLMCFLNGGLLRRHVYGVDWPTKVRMPRGTCSLSVADDPSAVLRRAHTLMRDSMHGFGDYDHIQNNCEDFAIYCKTGICIPVLEGAPARSGQALAGVAGIRSVVGLKSMPFCIVEYFREKSTDLGQRSGAMTVDVNNFIRSGKWFKRRRRPRHQRWIPILMAIRRLYGCATSAAADGMGVSD
ncbi:hypothetical protein CBR_g3617 [Chara braunii]|uniref:LRAT domain-containing protein n=1 Tax=Chara braunii TaxID=69332 RepID=A0A388KFT9_CHABU|nr:hypothetical protein CBR_g3617 [Chara braunii]|eukprot:GBG68918.1 hypothetical protein CBR_g3617 [Chara braunii]